jgi:hypothetical protein
MKQAGGAVLASELGQHPDTVDHESRRRHGAVLSNLPAHRQFLLRSAGEAACASSLRAAGPVQLVGLRRSNPLAWSGPARECR